GGYSTNPQPFRSMALSADQRQTGEFPPLPGPHPANPELPDLPLIAEALCLSAALEKNPGQKKIHTPPFSPRKSSGGPCPWTPPHRAAPWTHVRCAPIA